MAGSPELYPILVDMGCVPTLLACLSHENTDIAADTLELFMELSGAGGGGEGRGEEEGGGTNRKGDAEGRLIDCRPIHPPPSDAVEDYHEEARMLVEAMLSSPHPFPPQMPLRTIMRRPACWWRPCSPPPTPSPLRCR